ncbi:phage tail tip lysozyme [Roseomonas xinghualingensis]|uniref:phage tail tip lysozyme n=1 Tax=Roseomonas xinghualingensis TaxID=2986475 RepID=UPI0021F1C427|nr:phage tail tip lysozyme [Roseomonas sp. SXEYE001]MCV4206922.1 phage tail tip lysozyme [Roseomonas sp. SXEYE001]
MATASAGALSVSITALDLFTKPLARMGGSVTAFGTKLDRLDRQMTRGLGLDRLSRGARSVAQNLAAIVPPLSALTAAGSIIGVYRLASGWAKAGAELGRLAYRARAGVTEMGSLQSAAQLAGSSAEDMAQGMVGLGDAVVDAVGGRDDTAAQYFRMLGISMRDASGRARSASEVLPDVADGLKRIGDPALQARVMSALRLPPGLLPYLREGRDGLEKYRREAERLGVTSEAGAVAARQFEEAQSRLSLAGQGLSNVISARLAPTLVPLMDRFTNWVVTQGPAIAGWLDGMAQRFAAWVDNGGLTRVGERLDAFGSGIEKVVGLMGGWENAAIALGAVLTLKLLSPLTSIVSTLGVLAAFRAPTWMLRLLGIGGGVPLVLGAGWLGLNRLGEMRKERGTDDPEQQEERRRNFGARGQAGGFYDGPAVDPGGADAPSIANRLRQGWLGLLDMGRAAHLRQQQRSMTRSFTSEEATARQREAFERLLSHGWTEAQAAGVIANLRHESGRGLDHQAIGDNGRAYGIAQWHPDRQENFRRWAGKSIRESSLQEQVDFISYEMTQGAEQRAGAALRRQSTAAGSGQVVSQLYERPAGGFGEANARGETAQALLPQLRAGRAPAAAPDGGTARQSVDVRVRLEGNVPATVTTRTSDGQVRVERPALGATP